jgi:hypothetical protein
MGRYTTRLACSGTRNHNAMIRGGTIDSRRLDLPPMGAAYGRTAAGGNVVWHTMCHIGVVDHPGFASTPIVRCVHASRRTARAQMQF